MVTMLLSLVAFAQPPQPPRFNPAKFEADMEQFITTEVGLTPMEASRFFPLFREMQNKQRALFGKMRFYAQNPAGISSEILQGALSRQGARCHQG